MATTASPRPARATPPPSRRPPSVSTSTPSSIARGPAARSAATPRVPSSLNSPVARRASMKLRPSSPAATDEVRETRESLSVSLKHETEEKEQLLVKVQNNEQTIANLTAEIDNMSSALGSTETRLNELYADQNRMEEEMAARMDVSEKLRAQVRELEKEKRDILRRYNEQTATFEAERQAFYDNEQHLKSRIQSLTQARKQCEPSITEPSSEAEPAAEEDDHEPELPTASQHDLDDPETEPAEMTALRLELSTLSTSYTSLQSTLALLQTQLVDLQRVNHEVQEENESYMILLRERTLSGQFDVMRHAGGGSSVGEDDDDGDSTDADESGDVGSLRSIGRSTLDRVDESPEETLEQELERSLEPRRSDSPSSLGPSRHFGRRHGRSRSPGSAPRGESLADLPITGPGLDLAAELGRAENKDILDGASIERDRALVNGKTKRSKKGSDGKKLETSHGLESGHHTSDIDALRTEVKSLKDANKALSLYASKIIDRIISQEGFEHVLAVDYEKPAGTPSTVGPNNTGFNSNTTKSPSLSVQRSSTASKPRPQSVLVGRSTSSPMTTFSGQETNKANSPIPPGMAKSNSTGTTPKANRRSMSIDWKSFSMFGSNEKKPENPSLRPLTLKPGANPLTGARKLETHEDEDDRRERERLNATMKLMGIQQPSPTTPVPKKEITEPTSASPAMNQSRFSFFRAKAENSDASSVHSAPSLDASPLPAAYMTTPPTMDRNDSSIASPLPAQSRFSFFRSRTATENSDSSSIHSTQASTRTGLGIDQPSNLTQAALEEVEAENSLAALDAHERTLSEEIARGANGGFTEIVPRAKSLGEEWRSRRSGKSGGGSGSGSTVWSAGMDKGEDADD